MSGEGGTSCEVELVSCSLSELSSCLCFRESSIEIGSSRRKNGTHTVDISPEDLFLAAKRAILRHKPTLIDHLISQNRTALKMGPKKVKPTNNGGVKRKRESDTAVAGPSKKLKAASGGEQGKGRKVSPSQVRPMKKKVKEEPGTNRYATRISLNKVRIPFSLRSGRKMADILKKKKKIMRAKTEKDSVAAISDANGVKTDGDLAVKKEATPAKKATPSKKRNVAVKSPLQKKSWTKSDADGSTTSEKTTVPNEVEVKKKRRRKRCSMSWVNKTKKKKKESETPDGTEAFSEDEDDDDESGRVSDTSMLSIATQDSVVRVPHGNPKEEKPSVDCLKGEKACITEIKVEDKRVDKVEAEAIKKEDAQKIDLEEKKAAQEESKLVLQAMTEEKTSAMDTLPEEEKLLDVVPEEKLSAVDTESEENKLVDAIPEDEKSVVDAMPVLQKSVVDAVPVLQKSVVDAVPVLQKSVVDAVLESDENSHVSVSSAVLVKNDAERSKSPVSVIESQQQGATAVAEDVSANAVAVKSDTTDAEPVPATVDTPASPVADDVGLVMSGLDARLLLKTELSVLKEPSDGLIIAKCESLANTPLEKTVLDSVVDSEKEGSQLIDCIKEEIKASEEETTEVPHNVPLSVAKELVDCPQANGNDENDSEMKRDPDSTTCDNPRGLDDSFGDLTLYVSEEDLSHSKEHEEGWPDSTNLSQMEPSSIDGVLLSGTQPVKTELVLQQFDAADKSEPIESLTEEQKQMKESVLQALGLKSLSSVSSDVPEDKPPKRSDGYTGTLKAVIKLNRSGDKKHMVYKRSESDLASSNKLEYRICSELPPTDGKLVEKKLTEPGDIAEVDGASEEGAGKESNLIIPEKSSSFSIHPGRLCSDVCSYCFGKFGSLDTPCHVAQLKGEERQRKILENEPHLTGESCLCDACYRYVDRKANFPEKLKVGRLKPPTQASVCCVTHCSEQATRTIKRKWLIKLKKSITNKLNIDMEKLGHGVYYPFCTQHHYWVEYFTVCGICRKRLNRNNLFSLGSEADRLNLMLAEDGIPARLSVNLFLCKLCRYYADLRLKYPDPTAIPNTNQNFYKSYRRKILMSLDIPVSDSDDELMQPQEDSTKKPEGARDDGKADEDVMSLSGLATLLGEQPQQQARIQVKFGNVNIGTLSNLNIGQQGGSAASSSASTTSSSPANPVPNLNGASSHHKNEPTYPEVNLVANFEYQGPNTPDGSWERYQSTLQFDRKTKQLWTELQRPYGSQTSFLRHLVMLERVWRDGYLVLAPDADEAASRYITSARNRIKAFETQGPRMQTTVPAAITTVPTPVVATPPNTVSAPISRPPAPMIARKPTPVQSFPFLTNTGEIEVTPIRTNKPSPNVPVVQKAPMVQPRAPPPVLSQRVTMGPSQPRKITPLDRAKSLVRMAPLYQQIQQHVAGERRAAPGAVRLMGSHSSIPPLVRLPQTTPNQFNQQPHQMFHPSQQQQQLQQQQLQHQQQLQQHINQQQSFFQSQPPPPPQRVALPKLPRNLTVMSMPARPSVPQAITLSHSGITIEKQMAPSRAPTLPIERPSISVFREPATP